jgi:predicted TIM-barrel fold metal-dependent hydrolase
MKRIDAHTHVIPQAYVDAVPAPGGNLPKPPAVGAEALLAMMDRYAIDAAVISTGPPGAFFGDQARANEIARLANELIAETVHDNPSRFAGLAMLPLPDPNAALAELAHALDEMGFDGVLLLSHVAGTYLGDPLWEPLYAELDRRGAYVFLHPTVPANGAPLPHPGWLYEFPFDTTRALTNLIYTGTFERYPNIRWQVAHLGGATSVLAERIASLAAREPDKAEAAPAGAVIGVCTEIHMIQRMAEEMPDKTIVSLDPLVCPCSTMFRIDAPHLAWTLESLVEGKVRNRIQVDPDDAHWARVALQRMLDIT